MQAKASSSFQDHLGWDFTSVWGWRDSGEVKGNQICQTHSKTSLIAASNKSSLSWLSSHIRDPPRQIKVFCESSHVCTFGLFVCHFISFLSFSFETAFCLSTPLTLTPHLCPFLFMRRCMQQGCISCCSDSRKALRLLRPCPRLMWSWS